jgi:hypothetical protein
MEKNTRTEYRGDGETTGNMGKVKKQEQYMYRQQGMKISNKPWIRLKKNRTQNDGITITDNRGNVVTTERTFRRWVNKNIQEVEKKNSHRGGGKTRTEHGGD